MSSIDESHLLTTSGHSSTVKKKRRRLKLWKFDGINKSGSEAQARFSENRNLKNRLLCRLFARQIFSYQASPLHVVVLSENMKLARKLCIFMKRNSLSLDCRNNLKETPLHLAVVLGSIEVVELLLLSGASPNLCDQNGNTVLHLAVKLSNLKVLRVLLSFSEVKSALNTLDCEGYSVLHHAVMGDNMEIVNILHLAGAEMNRKDGKSGRTPLIHAVLDKNRRMIELLLECGSCPLEVDFSGRTAIDYSRQQGNVHLVIHNEEHSKRKTKNAKCL